MRINDQEQFNKENVFGLGSANTAYTQYFIGNSYMPGMVITIPAEVKHWHGAKKDSWFSHIAVEVPGEATSNEWCEPVDDAAYNGLE